jgi:hypothetical protein
VLFLALLPAVVFAYTIAEISKAPDSFDQQTVSVVGEVANLVTRYGDSPYTTFDLLDANDTALPVPRGLLLLQEIPDRDNKLLYLASMNDVKFRRPVVPGDQLRVEVDIVAWKGDLCKIRAKAFVGENLTTEASLMCVMVDRNKETSAGK